VCRRFRPLRVIKSKNPMGGNNFEKFENKNKRKVKSIFVGFVFFSRRMMQATRKRSSVHRCRENGLLGGGRTAADSAGNFPPNRNLRRNLKDAPSIRSRHVCVRSDLEGHTAHTKRKQHAEMRRIETLARDLLDVLPPSAASSRRISRSSRSQPHPFTRRDSSHS
jgi:hypothetical protein